MDSIETKVLVNHFDTSFYLFELLAGTSHFVGVWCLLAHHVKAVT